MGYYRTHGSGTERPLYDDATSTCDHHSPADRNRSSLASLVSRSRLRADSEPPPMIPQLLPCLGLTVVS